MDKQVKFLNVSSTIFKVLAWISAVFFVIVSIIVVLGFGGDTPRVASIVFLLGGGLYFLVLFTISEVLRLLVGLAEKSSFQGTGGTDTEVSVSLQALSKRVDRLTDLLEGKSTS
jgi:hypothetical protein